MGKTGENSGCFRIAHLLILVTILLSSSEELLNVICQEGPDTLLGDSESDTMVFHRTKID